MSDTIIIGITGASGSGKSLLSNTIVSELSCERVVIIPEDSYYKNFPEMPIEQRAKLNFDHPNAFDHDLLISHLGQLKKGLPIEMPIYNHAEHLRSNETKTIGKHKIIVLEGILLFVEPRLRDMLDIRIYMDTPLDISFIRRLERDIKERARTVDCILKQYQETVRPMYLQFIEPSKIHADVIIPRGGENRIAIDMIKAKMKELLNGNS
ncbi:MAG: uridine kinase [Gammaproteobacteria bacterium]